MNKKSILLVGAKGYIGSHLFSQLERKASISSVDYVNDHTVNDFINLDLTDSKQVNNFAENCNYFHILIFLVGLAHAKGRGKDLLEFKKVNYETIANLISALENNNKVPNKIIFSSTISVYGEKYHQNIYTEDSPINPFSPYAITKLQAEKILLEKFADKSWILRFAPVYSSDFLLNINRRTRIGSIPYRVGKGLRRFSLCNIENIGNVVEAIIKGKIPEGVYNLSDPTEYTYNELLKRQKVNWFLPIPMFLVKLLYYVGKLINNTFLKENTVKLISDNIFSSKKIRSHINFQATIKNI